MKRHKHKWQFVMSYHSNSIFDKRMLKFVCSCGKVKRVREK